MLLLVCCCWRGRGVVLHRAHERLKDAIRRAERKNVSVTMVRAVRREPAQTSQPASMARSIRSAFHWLDARCLIRKRGAFRRSRKAPLWVAGDVCLCLLSAGDRKQTTRAGSWVQRASACTLSGGDARGARLRRQARARPASERVACCSLRRRANRGWCTTTA